VKTGKKVLKAGAKSHRAFKTVNKVIF